MLDILGIENRWRFSAFGKHPAGKDYFRLGHTSPFVAALCAWVETGYLALAVQSPAAPDFWSWRFWARGFGKEALVCGVVRLSSDSIGRLYPLLIMGGGPLPSWEERWELLPFACEKTWCRIESIATGACPDLKKLEGEIQAIPAPALQWEELVARRHTLTGGSSRQNPFVSFLDLSSLREHAAGCAASPEAAFSLDHGCGHDKIIQLSLWHYLLKETGRGIPQAVFLGGNLEKSYLAVFRRALAPGDFLQLWSASSAILAGSVGMEDAMDLSVLGREPVRADQPAGMDVRFEPVFEELQTEVDRSTLSSATGAVDWEKVVRQAAEILSQQSKDLLVAGYLAAGLVHTRGVDGLAIGLKIYRDLLECHGVSLFPQRQRGRLAAMEWWLEKSAAPLAALEGRAIDAEQLALMQENLAQLTKLLRDQLPEAPSLQVIRDFLRRAEMSEATLDAGSAPGPVSALDVATECAEAGSTAPPSASRVDPPVPIQPQRKVESDTADGRGALEQAQQRLREAAPLLRSQDASNQLSYRLTRHAAWMGLCAAPPSESGRTRLSPPPAGVRNQLVELDGGADLEALVQAAEAQLGQFIFWLDLNRIAAEALAKGGHAEASAAVGQETAFLLQRLPGLDDLAFSDGTPFADAQTKQWLRKLLPGTASVSAPQANSSLQEHHDVIGREAAEAGALIREGKLIEAIDRLQERLNKNGSARECLQWRLTLSRVLINAAQIRFALPHLEQVVNDIDTFDLEKYDPAMALEGLKLAWHGFQSQSGPHFKEKANETLHRIGRLAPVEMIRLASATSDAL